MNIWNIFAPVYEFSMRSQKNIYDFLYARIEQLPTQRLSIGSGILAGERPNMNW